jgi:hypothetical protein
MNIRTTARVARTALLAGAIVFASTSSTLADRGRGRGGDSGCDSSSSGSSSSGSANSGGQSGSSAKKVNRQRLRLIGRVGSDNNGGVKTTVKYEARGDAATTTNRRFDVEVQGLAPGATLNVAVKGTTVATITADSLGIAKLELRPSPDDANEQPIPGSFPRLATGSVVTVGTVAVTLRAR